MNDSLHASVAHQIGFREAIARGLRAKPIYLMALVNSRVEGILPLFLIRTWWNARYLVSVPWLDYGGICADNPAAADALLAESRRIAQQENAQFVEFRSECRSQLALPTLSGKVTFLLDLKAGSDAVWKSLDAKVRNQIRRSQKSGLSVVFGGLEYLDEFYRVFCWKMRELGTPVWSRTLFENVLRCFPESAEMVLVKLDEITVGAALLLTHKNRQYIPSAAAFRKYLSMCPNHALYWNVIDRATKRGLEYFDFGRSSVDSSTYKFKQQWVRLPTPLEWQYVLHHSNEIPRINPGNPKYRLARAVWRHLPLTVANLLGPAVNRNFP